MEKQRRSFFPLEANCALEVGLDDVAELQAIKEEEAKAIECAIGMAGQNLSVEPEFCEEEVTAEEDNDEVMEVAS